MLKMCWLHRTDCNPCGHAQLLVITVPAVWLWGVLQGWICRTYSQRWGGNLDLVVFLIRLRSYAARHGAELGVGIG